jgi:hypothetical protein
MKILFLIIAVVCLQIASANDIVNFGKKTVKVVKDTGKGVGKWVGTEVIPSVTGERKIEIKPYIAITHDGQSILVGTNEAHIKVAGFSASTQHLSQRLMELGCIAETGGTAALICASALINQEIGKVGIPPEAIGGTPPPIEPSLERTEGNQCKTESSLCVTPQKRPIGAGCGCYNEKGDILLGAIQ